MIAQVKARGPFNKPFDKWDVREVIAPASEASKAIAEIIALAPPAERHLILALNMAVLGSLFRCAEARQFIQLAIEAER